MNIRDVLKLAHTRELQGMEFYSEQKEKVRHTSLKEIFSHLAEMEKGHAEYLEKQIENVGQNRSFDALPDSTEDDIFIKRMEKQKVEPSSLDADLGDYSIIRMAYLVEKDFASFYRESSKNADDGVVKDVFLRLAEWEDGHAAMLKGQMEAIIQRNALDLGFYPL